MKLFDRLRPGPGGPGPRYVLLVILALGAAMLAAAACGGSGGTPGHDRPGRRRHADPGAHTGGARGPRAVGDRERQARRVQGQDRGRGPDPSGLRLRGRPRAGGHAWTFFTPPAGGQSGAPVPQGGQSGAPFPQGAPSGAPFPQGAPSGAPMPQGGQSGAPFPQGGQGGFGGGASEARGTPGTVTAVKTNADGSASVTITLEKAPDDATSTSAGFATIETSDPRRRRDRHPYGRDHGQRRVGHRPGRVGRQDEHAPGRRGPAGGRAVRDRLGAQRRGERASGPARSRAADRFGGSGSPFPGQAQQDLPGGTQ